MIARIRKTVEEKDKGFTLVELLVVIAILGILTAIAVPTFLNQRNKAYDAAAKSDVANIGREVATYFVDSSAGTGLALYITQRTDANGSWLIGTSAADATPVLTGTVSKNVDKPSTGGVASSLASASNWCVAVKSQSGANFKYTQGGPATGAC